MDGLLSRLETIRQDIDSAEDLDTLEDVVGDVSTFLDDKCSASGEFGGKLTVYEEFNLKQEDFSEIEDIGARIFQKAAELKQEVFFDSHQDLMNSVIEEMQRFDGLGNMINKLGHSDFTQHVTEAGPSVCVFFDAIEDRVTSRTTLDFGNDVSGMQKILDAHVDGLKQFAETGSTQYPDWATKGIQSFGHLMNDETKEKLADVGVRHAEVIKLRAMAVIVERFQPEGQDSEFSLAHPDLYVSNPEDYPELDEYRRWLKFDDLESYLDGMFAESITAGRDMLHYARDEDKEDMGRNYTFAAGLVHKLEDLNLVGKSYGGYNTQNQSVSVQQDIERFKAELPDSVLYPQKQSALDSPSIALQQD